MPQFPLLPILSLVDTYDDDIVCLKIWPYSDKFDKFLGDFHINQTWFVTFYWRWDFVDEGLLGHKMWHKYKPEQESTTC